MNFDISSRFPKQKELAQVYAIVVLMVYGWTLVKFNYNLPGWLYFLNLGEVMSIFAYSMSVNFLESVLVLLGLAAAAFMLPKKWFLEAFVARAASLSIFLLGLMMYISSQFKTKEYYPSEIIRWSPLILVVMTILAYFLGRFSWTRKAIEFFADRATVFLYVSIPVSALSLIAVLIQNISR